MNKLTHRTGAKIAAVIFFIIFSAVFGISLVGTVYAADKGFYTDEKLDFYSSELCTNTTWRMSEEAHGYYMAVKELREEYNLDYDADSGKMYDDIGTYQSASYNMYQRMFQNTNFKFEIKRPDGKTIMSTYEGENAGYKASYSYSAGNYYKSYPYGDYDDYYGYTDSEESVSENPDTFDSIVINCYVINPLKFDDEYMHYSNIFYKLYQIRHLMLAAAIVSFTANLILFCFLMAAAGHRAGADGIHKNFMDRIPFDIYIIFAATAVILISAGMIDFAESCLYGYSLRSGIVAALLFTLNAAVLLMFSMTLSTRVKTRSLWNNTVIYRISKWIGKHFQSFTESISFIWKGVLLLCAFMVIEVIFYICALSETYIMAPLCIFFHLGVFILVILALINMHRIKESGEKLARGNIGYITDTNGMFWDFKKHAENLNSIGDGMSKAVEERMQSERMKTELITNVSHDIKTPLTSIINYVDLIKKENIEDETALQYLEVLDRQSARLKKLIEDLVEASKASTGNITAEPMPMTIGEMLSQTVAEYGDRLLKSGLEAVMHCDDSLRIMADGRLLWRVLDNLMGNVCKYSKEGTRVYIDAVEDRGSCKITIKNISRNPLNIDPEELMERFVRGDSSRATEGSGLGLSIARSLTELQGGSLNLFIDGDLFKTELRLPLA